MPNREFSAGTRFDPRLGLLLIIRLELRLMPVLITMPVEVYDGLLSKCAALSREYLILRNGVIRRDLNGNAGTIVEILCEAPRARFLRDFASLVYPGAVAYIERSISSSEPE